VPLDPARVGDRLAIAGASPRRPDVDEDRLAAKVCEGPLRALERGAAQSRGGLPYRPWCRGSSCDDRAGDDGDNG
jgi:hypothetical protein